MVCSSKLVGSCKNDCKWIKLYKNKNNITHKIQLQFKLYRYTVRF